MSIVNELSCDVAVAMLTHKNDPQDATSNSDLTGIVYEFHSTLRRLNGAARQRRRQSQSKRSAITSSTTDPSGSPNSNAASGSY